MVKYYIFIKLKNVNYYFSQAGALQKVDDELVAFSHVVSKNKNFAAFLANPTIPRADKTASVSLTRIFIRIYANTYYLKLY